MFFELTRSICPQCRVPIDAQVLLRDGKVFMRKLCPDHGQFEALVYADAEGYVRSSRFNKPGTIPLSWSTDVVNGCPHDCGLCPQHQQHACLGIIEVNSACNMDCPLCFANAGAGFNLSLAEVEHILDGFVATEGEPEVVQFSGGEPSIHPQIIPMLRAAKERPIKHVMLNTNGKRIASDDRFMEQLAEIQPAIYLQFDGFERSTYAALRGEPGLLEEKLRALDRLAEAGCSVILVPAIERGVNEAEVGRIIEFGISHPAVRGVNFQPAFHSGRHGTHDPMQRITIPDILRQVEQQMGGQLLASDFVPVPCCFPTCNSVTYAHVDAAGGITPLARLIDVEDHLDYIANRVLPDIGHELRASLERLWSSSAVPGSPQLVDDYGYCASCGIDVSSFGQFADEIFMVMLQDFMDPWTFNQKNLMKCCKEILLPDGKQIPFCAYNNVGYREQAFSQLRNHSRARGGLNAPFTLQPLNFEFPRPRP